MYAHYNPQISYCQGMNFLMGFLFNFIQDEEKCFKFFAVLVQNMLLDLLGYDLKKIKLLFYQIDRLIEIYLPALSYHFQVKEEKKIKKK